jgi:hypothetical protein
MCRCVHTFVCMCVHMCFCLCKCVCLCLHVRLLYCACVCVCTFVCVLVCVCTCVGSPALHRSNENEAGGVGAQSGLKRRLEVSHHCWEEATHSFLVAGKNKP